MTSKTLTIGEILKSESNKFFVRRFRQIAELFAEFTGWQDSVTEISIDFFFERRAAFRRHRRNQSRSQSEFTKYSIYIPRLIDRAKECRWEPDWSLSPEWRRLLGRRNGNDCVDLIRFFSREQLQPQDVKHDAIRAWADSTVIKGDSGYLSARAAECKFENLLFDGGYTSVNPVLARRRERVSIPLESLPEQLKKEVKEFLKFRVAKPEDWNLSDCDEEDEDDDDWTEQPSKFDSIKLSKRRQLRNYSADRLEKAICRLYYYSSRVYRAQGASKRPPLKSIKQMFRPKLFLSYKMWLIDDRLLSPRSIRNTFQILIASARQYHQLADQKWYGDFYTQCERETLQEERERRRARACVHFSTLEKIPTKIEKDIEILRARRPSKSTAGFYAEDRIKFQIAWLEMQKFLVFWMLELVWPTRNLCECRIALDKPGNNPNLVFDTVKKEDIARDFFTEAAAERIDGDSGAKVWHFKFSAEETSGCGPVAWTLPGALIDPLEAYLEHHRRVLVKEKPTDTLFVCRSGTAMKPTTLNCLFNEITLKYASARICPQVFRDIYAFEYLRSTNDDFPGLANILWHLNDEKTKVLYGRGPIKPGVF